MRKREAEPQSVTRSEASVPTGDETTHIDVYDVERAKATVIFYHGNITYAAFYHNFLAQLAAHGYRVLAPDRIGMGRSSGRPGTFTAQNLWDQAHGVMKFALAASDAPVCVVGHSVGGTLAYEHFVAEPRLAVCVANNIRHLASESKSLRERIELKAFKVWAKLVPWVRVDALGIINREASRMSEADRVVLRRVLATDGPSHTASAFTVGSLTAYIEFRAPGDHRTLDRPLMLLIGELDTELEMELAHEAMAEIDGPVTLEVVPGAGHFLLETDYERTAEIVDEWLSAQLR